MVRTSRAIGFVMCAVVLGGCVAQTGDKEAPALDDSLATEALGSADHAREELHARWCAVNEGTLTRRAPYQSWRFDGACDDVLVDVASRAGDDMFAVVYSRADGETTWNLESWNDDCHPGTLNACVELSTEVGREYLVVVSTYDYVVRRRPTAATYHLQVSCRSADGACRTPAVDEPQACGSRGLAPCPEGQYCDWDDRAMCGAADAPGVCRTRPEACIALYDPVCGCDGRTYGNACSAASHGIDVFHAGECPSAGQGEGETCAGIANLLCVEGLVCDFSGNLGCYADAGGVCRSDEPSACTREYAPVCGCDGVTYSNDCMRRAAGAALAHRGACGASGGVGTTCGGIAGLECDAGLLCSYADSLCGADMTGVCQEDDGPTFCIAVYRPVCGCDGRTYGNDCYRRAAHVALLHDGECR